MNAARLRAERELQKLFQSAPAKEALARTQIKAPPPPISALPPDDESFNEVHSLDQNMSSKEFTPFQRVAMRKSLERQGVARTPKPRESMRMRTGRLEPPSARFAMQSVKKVDKPAEVVEETPVQDALNSPFVSASAMVLSQDDQKLLARFVTSLQFALNGDGSKGDGKGTKHSGEVFRRLWTLAEHGTYMIRVLTKETWEVLWLLESENAIPSLRARMLGEIQEGAGLFMTEAQEIAYIGALFWNEARDEAMLRWEKAVNSGTATMNMWDLGIRIFALEKNPHKARETIDKCIQDLGYIQAKSWITLIMCWNHLYEPEKAWDCYQHMKNWAKANGETLSMGKYDDMAMSFLDGGAPQKGLAVFKDMLAAEASPTTDQLREKVYRNVRNAVQQGLSEIGETGTLEELSQASSDVLKSFPDSARDKYFYASWMKGLIKMGRTDLAWVIASSAMKDFGDKPDAQHINGVIKGFLSEEGKEPIAESIAEEMVLQRLRRVAPEALSPAELAPPEENELTAQIDMPEATIQTFSIMIKHYTVQKNSPQIKRYLNYLELSKIPPNSYIINHLLYTALHSPEKFQAILQAFDPPPLDLESLRIILLHSWKTTLDSSAGLPVFYPAPVVWDSFIVPRLPSLLPAPSSKIQPFLLLLLRAFLATPSSKQMLPDVLRQLSTLGIYPNDALLEDANTLCNPARRDRRRRFLPGLQKEDALVKSQTEAGVQGIWVGEVRQIRRDLMGGRKEEVLVGGKDYRSSRGEHRVVKLINMVEGVFERENEVL